MSIGELTELVLAQFCNKSTRQWHKGLKQSDHQYMAGSFAFLLPEKFENVCSEIGMDTKLNDHS